MNDEQIKHHTGADLHRQESTPVHPFEFYLEQVFKMTAAEVLNADNTLVYQDFVDVVKQIQDKPRMSEEDVYNLARANQAIKFVQQWQNELNPNATDPDEPENLGEYIVADSNKPSPAAVESE